MSIFEAVIDLVAPPLCVICGTEGQALCTACAKSQIIPYGEACWNCGVKSLAGRTCARCRLPGTPTYVWLSTTYEGAASELLKAYKFGHVRPVADSLSLMMTQVLTSQLDIQTLRNAGYIVVPVPTATSRRRERGFDHAELLAAKVARRLELKYAPVLGRLGQLRQVGSKRAERLAQSEDKYYVRLPRLAAGSRILLVDDVVTTGATLRAATKALRFAGARRVDALVFAKRL